MYGYTGGYYLYGDTDIILYMLLLVSMVVAMFAQVSVSSTFKKYSKVKSYSNLTGEQAARKILDMNGLRNVRIEHVRGNLTDHYDPRSNVLRLSDAVYSSPSIAAIGVAAHECGHAIQASKEYAPLVIRNSIVPVVNFASKASWAIIAVGFFLGTMPFLIKIGIILFAVTVFFQLITLPVEFDASKRALKILSESNMLYADENKGAKKVLTAAAMTYVAAAITAVLQLMRLISMLNRRD